MTDMFGFSSSDKFRCATREVLKRRQVYPRLVADKKLSKDRADLELDMMDAIAADYARASAVEKDLVAASLHKVGGTVAPRGQGLMPGGVLHFDIAVEIAGQAVPRIVRLAVPMGDYSLRCTLAECVRLINEQRASGTTVSLPNTKEAEALLA